MSQSSPRLRDDLKITLLEGSSTDTYVIEDPLRNRFYKIGGREYRFLCQLDSINNGVIPPESEVSEEEAMAILQWLGSKQLLQNQTEKLMQGLETAERQGRKKSLLNRLNLISFRIPLFNPDPFLDTCNRYLGWIAGPVFFWVWLLAALLAVGLLLTDGGRFFSESMGFFSPANILIVTLVWIVLKFLHELSHALACKRYGGGVYEFGVLFILFIPLTYVNASSSWSFSSRWQRIHVAVAGMYMELFVAWLAIIYWATHIGTVGGMLAHNTALIAGVSSLLFNANPLMRFDGYYILSDLTAIPNLYFRGLAAVHTTAMRFWLGINSETGVEKPSLFVRAYGISVHCWRIMVLFSLGYMASELFSGWGLLMTIVAATGWLYQPVAGFIARIPQYRTGNPSFVFHLAIRLVLVGTLASLLLFGISWKKDLAIPAVVLFEEQYSIRAETSGFVRDIVVSTGSLVKKGEVLVLLENDALESRVKEMKLENQILAIKERQVHAQQKYADLQILQERQKVLAAQTANLKRDRKALSILSPGSGVVVGSELKSSVGTYVSKGQELFLVVKPVNKQLLASVSQDNVKVFLGKVGKPVLVDMSASGFGKFTAVIERVAPTASRKLLHFSLAATYGGPFDVKPGTDQEQELVLFSPRFTVTVQLPTKIKQALRSGQQALVVISGSSRTPGSILWENIRGWFIGRQQR